jgi:hypothetical protein
MSTLADGKLTIDQVRTRTLVNGKVIELDIVLVDVEHWPVLLECEPRFKEWSEARFPQQGYVVGIEPHHN